MGANLKVLPAILKQINRRICLASYKSKKKSVTLENMHQGIRSMEMPLRSPILFRSLALAEELRTGATKSYKEVIKANLGDSHAMGQKPITFLRQVLILVTYPELMKDARFPADVKERANLILAGCKGGSIGSYTDCSGIEIIRRHCAEYIERRDGIHSDWQNITLSSGACEAIKNILKLIAWRFDEKDPGVMIPLPSFPLYSSYLQEFYIHPIYYSLDESKNWGVDIKELNNILNDSKDVCIPKAMIVNNPGNPTGQVMSHQNIYDIIKFASDNNLMIIADEVYQENIYAKGSQFYSFKKTMIEMGPPYCEVELASVMSISKGYTGEGGLRGGYTEIVNMDPEVYKMYLKSLSTVLCPSVLGQAAVDCVVNPPREDEPSFKQFAQEKNEIMDSFKVKANLCDDAFKSIEGITCTPIQGAFYAFPKIIIPPKALEAAKFEDQPPDVFYAFQLLEQSGICVLPGSAFGQKPGTWHFRTTILPTVDELKQMLKGLKEFHVKFVKKYS